MQDTPKANRLVMAILALIVGLFMIFAAPFLIQISLERVLTSLLDVSQSQPQYSSGILLFSLFYPLWRALGFVAGIILIAISMSIYQGQEWTLPVALIAHAIPAVSGMFMFLPYVSWVDGFPIPMVISWVGLAGFWTTILLHKSTRRQKLADFLALTFCGILATHAFVIGIAAQRMLMTRPEKPLFAGPEWWILTLSGEVNWIGVVMLMTAIPLLVMRKKTGWWLALFAALAILVVDIPTQILRTKTLDYLYGSLLSVGLLVSLLLPYLKAHLLGKVKT